MRKSPCGDIFLAEKQGAFAGPWNLGKLLLGDLGVLGGFHFEYYPETMITPDEIAKKASRLYPKFLKRWVQGEADDFFPATLPTDRKLKKEDISGNIRAVALLREKSKAVRGWGYTVHWHEGKSPVRGHNPEPKSIAIDELEDLLRLARPKHSFEATCQVAFRLRETLPGLEKWVVKHVNTIARYAENLEGLISVTKFFQENPLPDCYARQIPVDVHTKFIEENEAVLHQWLDILLPGSAMNFHETTFAGRFGLRDKQRHHALRLLDVQLVAELRLKFEELSLPMRFLAKLPVRETTVVIVENQLLLLTLPALPRTLVIRGEGNDVTRLKKLAWLHDNPILYWGDIDVSGFGILSRLRSLFPQVESIMMDRETLEAQSDQVRSGKGITAMEPKNLTKEESATFQICLQDDRRLEHEQICQSYVDAVFHSRLSNS